jgi:glycerate kinase
MHVVIAPDSFKGSISAADAAAALAGGWRQVRPGDQLTLVPLADGGEGTLDVLAAAEPASRWHPAEVSGPAGQRVAACWLELPGGVHVVELARASGLPLLASPDPMRAQTTGTGELVGRALDAGAHRILITLGGSASTDGGTGALSALGARFTDAAGRALAAGGGARARLAAADLTGLRTPPPGGVACLTDVRAPLLGPAGAAAVFGPQKGADSRQVSALEDGLRRLAAVLGGNSSVPGAGAAGGTGYGFAAAWGAVITPGAAEICRAAGLLPALAAADLVITGEGRYDATSADGKVTGTVLAAAAAAGRPAALVAGELAVSPPPGTAAALALAGLAGTPARARQQPSHWLRLAGWRLAQELPAALAGQDQPDRHPS